MRLIYRSHQPAVPWPPAPITIESSGNSCNHKNDAFIEVDFDGFAFRPLFSIRAEFYGVFISSSLHKDSCPLSMPTTPLSFNSQILCSNHMIELR